MYYQRVKTLCSLGASEWKNQFPAKFILGALRRKPGQIPCSHHSGLLLLCQHLYCSQQQGDLSPCAESTAALDAMSGDD